MLTIIVKGTNGCNLACSYCSLGKKSNFKYVDRDSLVHVFSYACDYALNIGEDKVLFILHGGEPTLVSSSLYKYAIEYVKENYSQIDISISMQSNGYILTDDYVKFIKEYDIHMGISIDGSEEIHDLERRTISGKPSYMIVRNNIDRMIKNEIKVSCLMVLTKNALKSDYEYLHYFADNNIHLKINPLLNYGEVYEHPELSLDKGDYAKYLIGLYEYIIQENIDVMISPIDNIVNSIVHSKKICECSFNKECYKHFLCIDYMGNIYPCGKFSDMDKFKIGNIDYTSVDEINGKILVSLFERRNTKKPNACNSCKYLGLCNCGCNAEAVIDGAFNEVPILCEDYKELFSYFHGKGLMLLRKELIRQKKSLEEQYDEL